MRVTLKHQNAKKALALLLCTAMLVVAAPVSALAGTLEDLNGQYEELEKQQQAIQDKLSSTQTEKQKQEAIRNALASQIKTTQQQISVLNSKISYLEGEIADKEEAIETLSAEVEEQQGLFMKRIRSIYMSSVNSNVLGMVLGLESFSSYLSCGKYLSRISEHDTTLLDGLAENIEELKVLREGLKADQADLASTKGTAESKKATLSSQKSDVEDTLQDIKKLEQEYLADKAAVQSQMKQIQADIDAIYAATNGTGSDVDYSKTGFIYPIKGVSYISSYYGWRFNNTDFHTGIDFPAANSTPIRASASGKVIYVRTGAGYGRQWGYGNYVIVDHGGGYSTLYAHCSSIPVNVGDTVTKGQTIAYVGTTGWSTGYHLHFEIRVNGAYTNPLNYL